MKKMRDLFIRKKKQVRPLEAIQVGISPCCNLKCTFCPTTFIHEKNARIMNIEDFSLLKPYFSWANWIYLQGWGEPLLNKNIWEMASLVKASDAKVGFTTNGTLMGTEVSENLVKNNIDIISVSIAGDASASHNKLRKGSEFTTIIKNIKALVSMKNRYNSPTPKISLSYMLTKESILHLPDTVKLAHDIGADDLYAINLDYVFSYETNESKIFTWGEKPRQDYANIMAESKKIAAERKFSFRSYLLSMEEQEPVCELDPNRFVFVTDDGDITPCTYLGRTINPRVFQDKLINLPRKTFGNIKDNSFEEIWNSADYMEFRSKFTVRLEEYKLLMNTYADYEPSLIILKQAEKRYSEALEKNPLPIECQSCPKAYGI
ncbi:MAG: hypothetical protein APF76_08790 [Desulfitibacter sp. BRH_c19]|nr:MAG: hypothetical protein APF76_08790 [Desulfitibacter sp. BRH_c19]